MGRVQGVGFRYFALSIAAHAGVVGYVRNVPDGNVEVVAEGDDDALEGFMADIRRGPRGADVSDVILKWSAATGEFDDFAIRH